MIKKKNSFPFFTLLICSLAIVMMAFIGYFVYNKLARVPEITFYSASAQKAYDGTPLTEKYWEMVSGELKEGHRVSVSVTGSQTNIGTSKNYFKVRVFDENGRNVSKQYMIIYDYGYLTVYDPTEIEVEIPPEDGSSTGPGDGSSTGNKMIYMRTSRSGVVYLRHKSYGNFTGVDWNERIPSYGNTNAINPLTYLSFALDAQDYPMEKMQIRADMGVTYTPYHFNNDTKICDADDRLLPYGGSNYTVNYYYQYDVSLLKKLSLQSASLKNEEKEYRAYVKDHYLSLTSNEKGTLKILANKAGIYAGDEDVIEKVAAYIQESATYNLDFEPYPDNVNHALYFLLEAGEGVCVQYATAATLMYRALGIPARYVTGYMGFTVADQWSGIDTAIGHAWVEVYIDGLGWIPVEVTPPSGTNGSAIVDGSSQVDGSQFTSGSGSVRPPKKDNPLGLLELTPVYVSKKYDGTPLRAGYQLTGFEEWEAMGYTYKALVSGEQTDYGYGDSIIESVILYDPDGNDVTSQFNLQLNKGSIHVYHEVLTSFSRDVNVTYGLNSPQLDWVQYNPSMLLGGHKVSMTFTAPASVGEYANSYEITVYDASGNDVSYFYEFSNTYGKLVVAARPITLTPVDVKKVYDGEALTASEYRLNGQLVSGHRIDSYVITGSQTEIGRSDSIMSEVTILDKEGNDVTGNYAITYGIGTLTVTVG